MARGAPGIGTRLSSLSSLVVLRLDTLQRRHAFLGFPWAVLRKYFDDGGARLAALITYYGFLSLFPLLLLAMTAATQVLRAHPELQQQLLDRLVSPELQPDLEQALAQLPSSGLPLLIGLVSLLFAGTGAVLAMYAALNKMWAVPWRDRYGLASQYARIVLVLILILVSAVTAAVSAILTDTVLHLPAVERGAAAAATAAALFAVISIAHKVLVCRPLRLSDIWVGGAIGAVVVTALINAAATLLPVLVSRAGKVYGSFATVVGIFTLLYLISQTLVLGVEVSTVIEARLSPRGLTNADLTDTDRRALVLQARRQERVAGQRITTAFAGEPGATTSDDPRDEPDHQPTDDPRAGLHPPAG